MSAYFDRFDICAAYNVYSQLWGWDEYTNGIQFRLSRIQYRPGHGEECLGGLSENAREIYRGLCERLNRTESSYVPCECCGADCVGTVVNGQRHDVPIGIDRCGLCENADCEIGADNCQVEDCDDV